MNRNDKVVLTGIKPTGTPHLGNYIGAIKPVLAMAKDAGKSLMFIADYHAINSVRNPEILKTSSREIAATFIALGLDTEETIFYRQSDVPEIFELMIALAAVASKGMMNRAHAYKSAIDRNRESGKTDLDDGINMGLYTYPILMAADILLYQSDLVPVGKDQIQHVEFARDMARSFNSIFRPTFKPPEHVVQAESKAIPGLDGRKMSKSYGNTIPLFAEPKKLRKLIMKIKTDSKRPEEPKDPETSSIVQLFKHFATPDQLDKFKTQFRQGRLSYAEAKQQLFETIDNDLSESRERYIELMSNPSALNSILHSGAEKAREIAQQTISEVREAMGIENLSCT